MRELKEAWFEFRGIRSTDMGVEMLSRPQREQPSAMGQSITVSGRSGRLWLEDGTWDDVLVQVQCVVPDGEMDRVTAWLSGCGELRFSDEPERVYRARVRGGAVRTMPFARLSAQQFTLGFDCGPFRYQYPPAEAIVLTESGAVNNPGTVASQPRIVIEGTGDITLSVGGCLMVFEGIEGGIVVDSEAMECFSPDGAALLNDRADMEEFPLMACGSNAVTWTGDVTKVSIEPRWRWL